MREACAQEIFGYIALRRPSQSTFVCSSLAVPNRGATALRIGWAAHLSSALNVQ